MKITTLSVLAALALSATSASALTLYTDPATGQVFTQAAEGRIEMGDFVDAKTVYMENQEQDSIIAKKEAKAEKSGYIPVKAKASKLQFSGTHYLGYKFNKRDQETENADGSSTIGQKNFSGFETRRNYLQVKAYVLDDPKSYMRVTLDTFQNNASELGDANVHKEKQGADSVGSTLVRLKYAYIYLDNILPYTGVEFGQVHRPWIDYEEHNAMFYRSITHTFVESPSAADLTNSADLGVNFKTKLPYFSSEIGVFNGEGYHQQESGAGNSFEWRLTAALSGNGDKKRKPLKDTYWDISNFGQWQESSNKVGTRDSGVDDGYDYKFVGFHTVYNQPSFLVAAQYIRSESENDGRSTVPTGSSQAGINYKQGTGYAINGTYRFGDDYQWDIFGHYDRWNDEKGQTDSSNAVEKKYWLAGIGYQYNKNVKFILNMLDEADNDGSKTDDSQTFMFTAEVHW